MSGQMTRFAIPEWETRYIMTPEALRALLEAEFGRGLDFRILVDLISLSHALHISNAIS
jgi:hypothetical protein